MERAAVLIGVERTGGLEPLAEAPRGARRMGTWARAQGFAHVKVLTDSRGRLEIRKVQDEIAALVDRGTVEQLVVYFAGHGVNRGMSEYWLLSRAPVDTGAAVNVDGSAKLARRCGIPHVVLISDACRTAAPTIQAQSVDGTVVFPNEAAGGTSRAVDQFYACAVGDPSFEVTDAAEAASGFHAVYTDALLEALGRRTPLLEPLVPGDPAVQVVRAWRLRDHLERAVADLLDALQPGRGLIQIPDAVITSRDGWLARYAASDTRPAPVRRLPSGRRRTASAGRLAQDVLLENLLNQPLPGPRLRRMADDAARGQEAAVAVSAAIAGAATPFGPSAFETRCGIKVSGALVTVARSVAYVENLGGQAVRVYPDAAATDVVLSFDNGTVGVFPAIREFLTVLRFADTTLVDVSFEPAAHSSRRAEYEARREELEQLRGMVAAAVRYGAFRLDDAGAESLALRMQLAKGIDPAMGLYAAYGYDRLGREDLIEMVQANLSADIDVRLFDIALLSGDLDGTSMGEVHPPVPMLAQGWALLDAQRVGPTAELRALRASLMPSVWTLFDAEAAGRLGKIVEEAR